jgi:TPP-dependent pyruvate/acetoin dehydrogenase alpha subunit
VSKPGVPGPRQPAESGPVHPPMVPDADLAPMLLIRHFERALLALFDAGRLSGTTHTCLGQEYVPVALAPLLRPARVFSNHRGHGHYLAQFGDPAGLLAEIAGRAGALCRGVGGSQHLYREEATPSGVRESFCSTGVQGENVSAALGAALHLRTTGTPAVAVAYVGDGTWGEGIVYESINLAALWRVPLLIVVENNGIAQTTPTGRAMAGTVAGRAAAFGVPYERIGTVDVAAIRERLAEPIERVRRGAGPLVVEFPTVRIGPHSKRDDTRDPAEIERVAAADWARAYARAYPEQFARLDERQSRLVASVVDEVLGRPLAAAGAR